MRAIIAFIDHIFDVLSLAIRINHSLVVYFLIAILAKTTRVMRPVLVLALRSLLLVALAEVAEVAH